MMPRAANLTIATSRSANESRADFALFCNPESRRVEGFSIALGRSLRQRPVLIPWRWVLQRNEWPKRLENSPRFLRLESSGRNWSVEKELLAQGAQVEDEEAERQWNRLSDKAISELAHDPGRVLPTRQWYLGWRSVLNDLSRWAKRAGLASRWLCPPENVALMFDKMACQRAMEKSGLPMPPTLGIPCSFDELWEMMRRAGRRRIFLKPCHGSSASGVVALEASRTELQAFSTLELVEGAEGLRMYNHREIKTWRGAGEVRRLVDAACGERCLAQVWVPKAGLFGRPFDLRVVVIRGRARNVMMRLGRGPMTNSQLLGGKGDVEVLRRRMGEEAWARMLGQCEEAMRRCFPGSLYAGFDVLVEPNFRSTWILEVNAFGDLLPRNLHEGRGTYDWEIAESLQLAAG
jgi:glutathione synthase/RimK-type ligase-like ATP-grasp enzyme